MPLVALTTRAIGIKVTTKCSQIYWYIFLWSTLNALFFKLSKWFPDLLAEYIICLFITGLHHPNVIIITLTKLLYIYVLYSFISGSILGKEIRSLSLYIWPPSFFFFLGGGGGGGDIHPFWRNFTQSVLKATLLSRDSNQGRKEKYLNLAFYQFKFN